MRSTVTRAQAWIFGLLVALPHQLSERNRDDRDRGDVPGWVMITVMTAIVVIVLLGVFRDQVKSAVESAFGSVTDQMGN